MILLTGGSGQVGRSILEQAKLRTLPIVAPSRAELDLSDSQSIAHILSSQSWSAIINAGAYTAVDQSESEPDRAMAVNGQAPALLARYCHENDIPLIHFSTDYVFAGDKSSPYVEDDHTAPLGVYGHTKLAGEHAVLASGCRAVILRTAWVVSPYGKNFIKTMLRLAKECNELRVVGDQYGCPTGAPDLADVIVNLMPLLKSGDAAPQGVYHCTNAGQTTWAGLARAVMATSAQFGGPKASVMEITSADYPTPAKRPHNSRLSCEKLKRDFGFQMRPWQAMVEDCVTVLMQVEGSAV